MQIDLDPEICATILESLTYSKERIVHAQDVPYELRQETLAKIENAQKALRSAKRANA